MVESSPFAAIVPQPMSLAEYQVAAARFSDPSRDRTLRLAVAGMGLSGEAAEVLEEVLRGSDHERMLKEIGDVAWYCAEVASALGLTILPLGHMLLGQEEDTMSLAAEVVVSAGRLTDTLKKMVGHGHAQDDVLLQKMIQEVLTDLALLSMRLGASLGTACAINIQKLSRRYSNGFSSEASINRVPE